MGKLGTFLQKETAGLPNWAWILVIIGGAGAGYYFVRKNSAATSTAGSNAASQPSATGQSTSGAAGSYGSAIDYSSSLPVSATNASSPVYVLGTSPTPTPTNPTPQPPQPTPQPPQPQPTPQQKVTVRQPASSGQTASYDSSHSGVPIHSGPSWQTPVMSTANWGSQVPVTGPAVSGGSNFPNGFQGGSTMWYPVAGGGFISSYDIAGIGGGGVAGTKKKALAIGG